MVPYPFRVRGGGRVPNRLASREARARKAWAAGYPNEVTLPFGPYKHLKHRLHDGGCRDEPLRGEMRVFRGVSNRRTLEAERTRGAVFVEVRMEAGRLGDGTPADFGSVRCGLGCTSVISEESHRAGGQSVTRPAEVHVTQHCGPMDEWKGSSGTDGTRQATIHFCAAPHCTRARCPVYAR